MSEEGVWVLFGRDVFDLGFAHMVCPDEHTARVVAESSAAHGFLLEVVFIPYTTPIDYEPGRNGIDVSGLLPR